MTDPASSSRKDTDAKEILKAAKSSIGGAAPRRGGYVPKAASSPPGNDDVSPISQSKFEESVKLESTRNKGCPCASIMEKESMLIKSVAYGEDKESSCPALPVESLYKKSNFSTAAESTTDASAAENASMLAIVISTVMLMASEYPRIPDEYLEYTKNYLECIKDGNEEGPPNIQGILKHIEYLRENGLVRPMGEESRSNLSAAGAERVASNTIAKSGRSLPYKKYQVRPKKQLTKPFKAKSTAL